MPHFCGGNRQAPIRRKTYIQGGTMSSAPAANTYVEHSGASDAGCAWLRRGGGALARHRCVRDGHHALFDANHHISADKALSASHAQRSGTMVLAAWGVVAWCASGMGNALQLW